MSDFTNLTQDEAKAVVPATAKLLDNLIEYMGVDFTKMVVKAVKMKVAHLHAVNDNNVKALEEGQLEIVLFSLECLTYGFTVDAILEAADLVFEIGLPEIRTFKENEATTLTNEAIKTAKGA